MRNSVEKNYLELKSYLGDASAQNLRARRLFDKGDWKGGRAQILQLIKDYHLSSVAQDARIPVEIVTRPEGAKIYRARRRLALDPNDPQKPLLTPAVIFCPNKDEVKLTVEKAGFEVIELTFAPSAKERINRVLSIIPSKVFQFAKEVQTAPGTGASGRIAVLPTRSA